VQPNVQQLAQSAQNVVQQNVLLHALSVVHSISQLGQNAQSVQQLVHSISRLAQNVQQLAPNAPNAQLLVHSISQLAISRSRHVIVAPQLDAIANHILSLKPVVAMSQKILAQMIHTSHQTWQMPI
jgi:isopentenyl diphosphate isomerase/L-lactate dehydrogenase-like FMN-dependent dehydrogenase